MHLLIKSDFSIMSQNNESGLDFTVNSFTLIWGCGNKRIYLNIFCPGSLLIGSGRIGVIL